MPVQSWGHTQYWRFDDGLFTPPVLTRGGYPGWQAGVICGSAFGALQWGYERLGWWLHWIRQLWRLPDEQRLTLQRTVDLLSHPAYVPARAAVRDTAVILGFNSPAVWAALSHTLKERRDWAENSWRHLKAMQQLDAAYPGLTNPEKNALIELAYVAFTLNPRNRHGC